MEREWKAWLRAAQREQSEELRLFFATPFLAALHIIEAFPDWLRNGGPRGGSRRFGSRTRLKIAIDTFNM